MSLRVAFMGTPEFAVPSLQILNHHFKVVGVYTQPDRPSGRKLLLRSPAVKQVARELGLPVFQVEKHIDPSQLKALKPDVVVVVAYGQILKKKILELPPLGCINVHASLLPRWRGAAPIQWALMKQDSYTGISILSLVEKLDAGPVLLQAAMKIQDQDTFCSLQVKLSQLGAQLILETLQGLPKSVFLPLAQDESQVTFAPKLHKSMGLLDPKETALQLQARVRALNPWPSTRIDVGEWLYIKEAQAEPCMSGMQAMLFENSGRLFLGTSQGCLRLLRLHWEGKKAISDQEFLNALRGQKRTLPLSVLQRHSVSELH